MEKRDGFLLIGLLAAFGLFRMLQSQLFLPGYRFLEQWLHCYPLSYFLTYLLVGLPVLLFTFVMSNRALLKPLGLKGDLAQSAIAALIFSVPMFIGYGAPSGFTVQITAEEFWSGCVFAAFFEELYFRGFFFGLLFRKVHLGFLPALILPALVFASLHLYQSQDPATLIGIFLTTFMGAGLFAWLYCEWSFNLWVPIFLHFLMNLSWGLFDNVAENALGDLNANVFRGMTIALSIIGTIWYKRKKGSSLMITRQVLFSQGSMAVH